jgi:hypothetical protein
MKTENIGKIHAKFLRHMLNATAIGVDNFVDVVDNFVDCFADEFGCDPIELKKYLITKFN